MLHTQQLIRIRHWLCHVLLACFISLYASAAMSQAVTLNFKDADLEAIINWVAEQTGKNFIIDPRVRGKVSIISGKPLNESEVYEVFLSVLQVHGFAAVPTGDIIKIMPDVNAKQSGVRLALDGANEGADEMVTRVIQVENVSAAQLVPILRPLIPQQGHMVAYTPSNSLIISDRVINIERVIEIIKRIDQPSAEEEIEVISLQYASASEVVRIITALEQANKQAPQKQPGEVDNAATLVADERSNSILLGGGKTNRLRMRALITHLDIPLEKEGDIHVIYLRYANAKNLVPVLTGIGENVAKGEAPAAGQARPVAAKGSNFTIQADEHTNALVITAPIEVFRPLQTVIRQLDVRRAQVQVEAIIAELTMKRAAQLGVQWAIGDKSAGENVKPPLGFSNFGSGSGQSLGEIGAAIAAERITTLPEGLTLGLGKFNQDGLNFAAIIRALSGDGSTNILSTPTLVTMDNQEAEIVVGQNVPLISGTYSTTAGASPTNPFNTITRQNVGISLKVKPQINEGNTIKLDVTQKVEDIAVGASGAADLIINTRAIDTSVLVDDGDILVLGGLIKDDLKESVQKVPLLGDLPLLGTLFRNKSTTKEKTNLMVFLHPIILRDSMMMAEVTNSKYNFIRAQQMTIREKGVPLIPNEESPLMPAIDQMFSLPPPPEGEVQRPAMPDTSMP